MSAIATKLVERRNRVWNEAMEVADRSAEENRAMTGEEQGKWDALNSELDALDARIKSYAEQEQRNKDAEAALAAVDGARTVEGAQTGSYTSGPRKLVLHTTEGALEGALAAYANKRVVPHFTWDRASRRRLQHVDTDRSVSALANDSGGVQTNRDGAIQVEITGFAADSHNWSDSDLRWIAEGIKEVCEVEGIDWRNFRTFVGEEAGTIAREDAPQRMSFAEWDAFDGVCGHQHVPENHHWDPGRLNYPRILGYIEENDDMTPDQAKRLERIERLVEELVLGLRDDKNQMANTGERIKETLIKVRELSSSEAN